MKFKFEHFADGLRIMSDNLPNEYSSKDEKDFEVEVSVIEGDLNASVVDVMRIELKSKKAADRYSREKDIVRVVEIYSQAENRSPIFHVKMTEDLANKKKQE